MPIDLNRFIATFFDEAQEHLETIEEMAMTLGSGALAVIGYFAYYIFKMAGH